MPSRVSLGILLPIVILLSGMPGAIRAQAPSGEAQFWSFRSVKPVSLPHVKNGAWVQSSIDRFILSRLEAKGLEPAQPADKRTLIRRATFDLIGLPPTPGEIDSFLADESPEAFARVVDRLLASPAYGVRWGRHWLDVVRYADARDLIQLPPESDFREIWRYRDWVVDAVNRDLPFTDFIKYQIAGDLLQPVDKNQINKDALIATGMLALADFVPGDTDKEMMIADYVNDEIDVVGRGILGLTLACARCHDHKFDPIGTRDYYALAGIFFSTRLVPAPVAGNTPLVRVPLLAPAEIARIEAQRAADRKRVAELEQSLPGAADREYRAELRRLLSEETARYLVAAWEFENRGASEKNLGISDLATKRGLNEFFLSGWVALLSNKDESHCSPALKAWCKKLQANLTSANDSAKLARSAKDVEHAIAEALNRKKPPSAKNFDNAIRFQFRADDPALVAAADSHVSVLPNRAEDSEDAAPPSKVPGPVKATALINGSTKTVLRFGGKEMLEAAGAAPPSGAMFLVFENGAKAAPGGRLVGWEDADAGQHGLGLMLTGSGLHAVVRDEGKSGDIAGTSKSAPGFHLVSLTWGHRGVTLHIDRQVAGTNDAIKRVSADPAIRALHIGGSGSGRSPKFQGDLAELRVYDQQPSEEERGRIEAELFDTWFKPANPNAPKPEPHRDVYQELYSSHGPFSPKQAEKTKFLPAAVQARLSAMRAELETLKKKPALEIPSAVAVQDGGPKGSPFEGLKDAHIFRRGNPKAPGAVVPRGFPEVLAGSHQRPIAQGSGRLQLADWLVRADNPLTARVLVNRLWQHHFGDGIVRTANNFGDRGMRPTHPDLLDYLASRFVQSGWSMKAMHRQLMLSATYQQSTRTSAEALASDPENELFGRMNRRRLEAEAIRDSMLATADRLDSSAGGPGFQDLAVPRRTLYFMSVRTGEKNSKFGSLFDRPDPSSIIEKRGMSTTAPQALFLMNDPFVAAQAKALAERVALEEPTGGEAGRIRRLYAIVLGRQPNAAELNIGLPFERYCHMLLCANEFLFVD